MKIHPQHQIPKLDLCLQCKFVFTLRTFKYYCCDKKSPVCPRCINIPCKICKMPRNKRLNITCFKCISICDEEYVFYDFKAKKHYCAKCLSQGYIYHYQKMVKEGTKPKDCLIKVDGQSQYNLEDFINFYKNWCFCCIKKFNINSFEMIHGARICSRCLETNFDLASPKLIMCVQCNGYIHQRSQIQLEITLTQVICVYCSKKEKTNYNDLIKKYEQQAKKTKPKQNSGIKNSNVLVSAVQISKVGSTKMSKVISRSSIQQESIDFPIKINLGQQSLICILCNCKFNLKSVFTLTEEEIEKFKLAKSSKSSVMCFVCFNYKEGETKRSQKEGRIFGVSQKEVKQLDESVPKTKTRSNRIFVTQAIPKSPQKNILKTQI